MKTYFVSMPVLLLLQIVLLLNFSSAYAIEQYQTPEKFIQQAFGESTPQVNTLWITGELRESATRILKHKPVFLRTRYWHYQTRSAWIMDEIGKDLPITVGIVINNGEIERLKVLTFRESRGGEVKHDFFTRQFNKVRITEKHTLSKPIDGITGATLSVRALKRLAALALYLEQHVNQPATP